MRNTTQVAPTLNRFSPIGETNMSIQKFLFSQPARRRKNKYGVTVGDGNGNLLVLFTRASSFKKAFQIAKSAYKSAPYPKVGVSHFVVHGICQSGTCHCGGDWRTETFPVDWSISS
jgi:hypothetical protein